jgi:ubiquinone/menaquinone biosynthesis C-methylase UbiE
MDLSRQISFAGEAFSRQSLIFDQLEENNVILTWMRGRVRSQAIKLLKPGDHILELNSGTGLDAFYFHSLGLSVHATDVSEGMINVIQKKIGAAGNPVGISAERLSYTELNKIPACEFDYIFSNFGGLNCIPDLSIVINEFGRILKPGGRVTLVLMPEISPWEILTLLKGNTKMASRRFQKDGADSNVEGVHFKTWYFNPGRIKRMFGSDYKLLSLQSLGTFVPPPHHAEFGNKYPRLFKILSNIERTCSGMPLIRNMGDHYILSMEYKVKSN